MENPRPEKVAVVAEVKEKLDGAMPGAHRPPRTRRGCHEHAAPWP